jgi:ABC-2 type transport system permease protein
MIGESVALATRSLKKWIRNPFAVMVAAIQAIFWLALFGNSFNPANAFASRAGEGSLGLLQEAFGGASNYITFLTPGVIGIIALTSMSFMGVDLVLDRINGYLGMISTYPIPRTSIYFAGVLQNIVKGMVTGAITFALALIVPNGLRLAQSFGILDLLGLFMTIVLLTSVFATLFTGIAISVKSTDSFFPLSFFPSWLKPAAQVNPISLASESMRLLMNNGALSAAQLSSLTVDLVSLVIFLVFFTVLGSLLARNALKPR